MDNIIEVRNLKKTYDKNLALDNISLDIKKGRVVGLLGPNGSGKSTLIKSMAGLVKSDEGEVLVNNRPVDSKSREDIVYLPDGPFIYKNFKASDAISLFEDFYNDFNIEEFEKYEEYLNIDRNSKIRALSKGDLDKLGICLNLARDSKIYLFDEPLDGIDPITAQRIIGIIIDKIDGEKTFIISTHQIALFENLFDEVIFLNNGSVHLRGMTTDLEDENQMKISDFYDRIYVR